MTEQSLLKVRVARSHLPPTELILIAGTRSIGQCDLGGAKKYVDLTQLIPRPSSTA